MLILAKAILAFMIGFILTIIFGLFVIPILKKLKIKQVTSSYVLKHKSKSGTPTMGGIIFIIPTIISIFILTATTKAKKNDENSNNLNENCSIFNVAGKCSNGNISKVIIQHTIPVINENK